MHKANRKRTIVEVGMSEHTKGPWVVNADCEGVQQVINPDTWQIVANLDFEGCSAADLSLILAAPEMLEALQDLLDHDGAEDVCHKGLMPREQCARCARIDKGLTALRKAKGEA